MAAGTVGDFALDRHAVRLVADAQEGEQHELLKFSKVFRHKPLCFFDNAEYIDMTSPRKV